MVRRLLGVALALGLSSSADALDPDRSLKELHHTAWRARDGAPSQISALAQTRDGYLWIGSALGLFRFDGIEFERYVAPAGTTLPSHNIYALEATPDGGLWISFRPSGVGFLKDGRLLVRNGPEDPAPVFDLAADADGRVWAATPAGLALWSDGRFRHLGPEWGLPAARVWALLVDREGTLWVAMADALLFLRRGADRFLDSGAPRRPTHHIAEAPDGELWTTDTDRLMRARSPGHPITAAEQLDDPDFLFDRHGALWASSVNGGVFRWRFAPDGVATPGTADVFDERDGLTGDLATNVLEDREGNIWVGTARGLDRFRHNEVVPVRLPPGYQRLTLAADRDGAILAGTAAAPKPFLRLRADSSVVVVKPAVAQVSSVYRDEQGTFWWGVLGGLVRQRGEAVDSFALPPQMAEQFIWEVFPGEERGTLWASVGDFGLRQFQDGHWTERKQPEGLPARGPSASHRDAAGHLWLGYTANRVYKVDAGHVQAYGAAHGIDVGRIRVIRGRGPHLWVGGELGLALFLDDRFRRVRTTETAELGTVTGIIERADGSLWLNEMNGVIAIPAEEVRRLLHDPLHRVSLRRYDYLDGLPGAPQMNWTVSTAVESSDGRLSFATDDGLARIDPSRLRTNPLPPPVTVRFIQHGDQRVPATGEDVTLPVGTRSLRIGYTALSLAIPERVQFRTRMDGIDSEWSAPNTRREVSYTNLRPGRYVFRVMASNEDGLWNEEGATLSFEILPAFYQTAWFVALCAVAGAALLGMVYAERVRQVQRRLQLIHDQRLEERTRIARELHDTLLQGVISVSMQLHAVGASIPAGSPDAARLDRVIALLRQVTEEGRNVLRGLRPAGVGAEGELEHDLARVPQEVAGHDSVGFEVMVTGKRRLLRPLVADEVYRIAREALVNAFRHAHPANVAAEIEYLDSGLRVVVRDDGRGIPYDVVSAGRADHYGLTGMRERAERIGGRLRFSTDGAGTRVELSVPATIAFVPSARAPLFQPLRRFFARGPRES